MLTQTTTPTETPRRRIALLAGISYLAVFALAIFANFFVRAGLVDPTDPAATFTNIADSEALFRSGLFSFLIVFLLDVAIAWALYVLFKSANKELSRLTAWFRLAYTVFLGVALIFFFLVLELASGGGQSAFGTGLAQAQVTLLLEAFNYTWYIGLAAFGIHLVLVGYLLRTSAMAPRLLSTLLMVAGAAYLIDTTAISLLSNYSDFENIFLAMVALPSVVGELALAIWLLRGANTRQPVVG